MHQQEISNEAKPYLASALKHFGADDVPVNKAQVVKARIEGNEFVLLWDRGINGIAKAQAALSALKKARRAPKAEVKAPKDDE